MTGNIEPNRAEEILVVSGLPRSGTSMMMKMLAAAGYELVVDERRAADENNPNGYFEYEPVKSMKDGDTAWMDGAQGKALKVVSPLLPYLPGHYRYGVIFMQRDLHEVMASQTKMLNGYQKPSDPEEDRQVEIAFRDHLRRLETWLGDQSNIRMLYVDYNRLLDEPDGVLPELERFLERPLNARALRAVIDPSLYRNRHTEASG